MITDRDIPVRLIGRNFRAMTGQFSRTMYTSLDLVTLELLRDIPVLLAWYIDAMKNGTRDNRDYAALYRAQAECSDTPSFLCTPTLVTLTLTVTMHVWQCLCATLLSFLLEVYKSMP